MYRSIVVGFDDSEAAKRALAVGAAIARQNGARLHVVTVEESLPAYPGMIDEVAEFEELRRQHWDGVRSAARRLVGGAPPEVEFVVKTGSPAEGIVSAARELGADLIVIGPGHSRLWHPFFGSTAHRVAEHAPCDVLIARQGGRPA